MCVGNHARYNLNFYSSTFYFPGSNHPAKDVEVVWFGPRLPDLPDNEEGRPAYGNVAFNIATRSIELLITEKGFNCYWVENFVFTRNTTVRCSSLINYVPDRKRFSGFF